jgi:biotin carboxylase
MLSFTGKIDLTHALSFSRSHANGAAFVYFGMQPVDISSSLSKILIAYTRRVLDALEIKHGPTHAEVMMTADGPCLVEMNCRAHGGDGNWRPLGRALTGGYSQVEATVDAFVDPISFKSIPDVPCTPFKASGQEVILVSFSQGKVRSTPGFEVIKHLPSFVCLESSVKQGSNIDYTVDLLTGIGSVIVMHKDEEVVKRDIDFIRYMETINGLFVYETKLENLKRPNAEAVFLGQVSGKQYGGKPPRHQRVFSSDGPSLIRHMSNDRPELRGPLVKRMTTVDSSKEAVIIVDPYSTGAVVASEIMKRGFSCIALWTRGFAADMKTHVPISCGSLNYFDEIDEAESLDDTMKIVYKAAGQLRVVACLAGGEAGVDLADALSEKMNVRTNGTSIPNRRDKKIQQELIKAHGLRSVRQSGGAEFSEVEDFLKTEPYPIVLKPVESAGSDGVKLCHTFEEAKEHFEVLMQSQMVNGGFCPAVLCQEFLRGKEYVVDHVSRDGEHKAVMVWVYDKRPKHGSAFVYYGCIPVDSESPEAKILIPYVRGVLDALEFKNGPSHAEVMMTPDGPCLVEMNCRAHGGDANWRPLCRALTGGYSQVEATVDCFLDKAEFARLPSKPVSPFKAAGQEVILVCCARGTVKATPGFEDIKNLESFVYLETGVKPGTFVDYTVDLFTGIGSVILMHHDPDVLKADVERVRLMESDNTLFVFENQAGIMKSPSMASMDTKMLGSNHSRTVSSDRVDMY